MPSWSASKGRFASFDSLITVLIEKLCEAGNVGEAKAFWKDMVYRSLEPEASAYDSMILGLSEQGNVAEGMQYLDTMLKSRLKPQNKTFERLIQYLFEANRLSYGMREVEWNGKWGVVATGKVSLLCLIGSEGCKGGKCRENDLLPSFTDVGLDWLALGCGRTLKSLEVVASAKITYVSLEAVGSYCRSLETLSLESEFICNKGLLSVAKGCPLLISLELLCSAQR
ncbi:putative leucine-rich repeat domain [Forsythia ovata]|uniref:Leucine-rich repeat domain n=1 Tax=Forsythia ovata TaxID=205694 RepID=A0ABD1WRT2_9LAMI